MNTRVYINLGRVIESGSEVSSGNTTSLSYGNCIADEDAYTVGAIKTFTVENNGTAPLTMSSITKGGAAPEHYVRFSITVSDYVY